MIVARTDGYAPGDRLVTQPSVKGFFKNQPAMGMRHCRPPVRGAADRIGWRAQSRFLFKRGESSFTNDGLFQVAPAREGGKASRPPVEGAWQGSTPWAALSTFGLYISVRFQFFDSGAGTRDGQTPPNAACPGHLRGSSNVRRTLYIFSYLYIFICFQPLQ